MEGSRVQVNIVEYKYTRNIAEYNTSAECSRVQVSRVEYNISVECSRVQVDVAE